MHFVDTKWYRRFNNGAFVISALIMIFSILSLVLPSFNFDQTKTGFSILTAVLPATHILYLMFFKKRIANRTDEYNATLLGVFIYMVSLVTLIHTTGKLGSHYHLAWVGLVFFTGMFGPLTLLGFNFLTTLYLILVATDVPGEITLETRSIIGVTAVYAISIASYLFWKGRFINTENVQIRTLTGELKSKQQQAEILIESITDGMIVVMPDGRISLMNPAAATMTEWNVQEAVGIDVHLVIKLQTEDGKDILEADNPFTQVFAQKQSVNQTLQLIGRNGKLLTVSVVVSPVIAPKSEQVNGAVAIIRDISAARAEEKRRADFISTASHEMRTPVAAIEGYLALAMNSNVSSIDEKARSYLEKAHSSTQHLGKLFQDLLTSAKAEDGRLVNHPTAVEMGQFLEQLTDSFRFAAEKKGLLVDFIVGISGGSGGEKVVKPLYYVHVDPDRLSEVITNLFDNAVKYTETGKISLGLTGNNEVVQLYVNDTGPGIPAEDVPHLFQKFYRVDSSSTRTIGGTGLGLFICKKIIELYKGRIWVESKVGQGSTFYINLPRLSTQKANEISALSEAQAVTPGPGPA